MKCIAQKAVCLCLAMLTLAAAVWLAGCSSVRDAQLPTHLTPAPGTAPTPGTAPGSNPGTSPRTTDAAHAGVQPGEELWVIVRADDANGTGDETWVPLGRAGLTQLDAAGKPVGSLPLTSTTVTAELRGDRSTVAVSQQFVNNSSRPVDAEYRMPMPADATLEAFVMKLGERRIRGVFRSPGQASALFESAREAGHRASLIVLDSDNTLTHRLANLQPAQPLQIELAYVHTLELHDGAYRFVLPAMVPPQAATPPALAVTVSVCPGEGVDLESVTSLSHPIERERVDATCMRVTLAEPAKASADRPFELVLRPGLGQRLAHVPRDRADLSPGTPDAAVVIDAAVPDSR